MYIYIYQYVCVYICMYERDTRSGSKKGQPLSSDSAMSPNSNASCFNYWTYLNEYSYAWHDSWKIFEMTHACVSPNLNASCVSHVTRLNDTFERIFVCVTWLIIFVIQSGAHTLSKCDPQFECVLCQSCHTFE